MNGIASHGRPVSNRIVRAGGILYLIIIAIGAWGEGFVRGRLVSRDPSTTAANIKAALSLWRSHVAAELFLLSCTIVLLAILYAVFRPINRDLALLAAIFNIVEIAIEAVSVLGLDLAPNQSPEMTRLLIRFHDHGFGVSLVFFGWFCIIIGYLILKSRCVPKVIGALMQIAGVCYLINSFALIASPQLTNRLFPAILIPSFIGELSLALWLAIKGIAPQRGEITGHLNQLS